MMAIKSLIQQREKYQEAGRKEQERRSKKIRKKTLWYPNEKG